MPTRIREESAGAVHHVFARSVDPVLFRDAIDFTAYLAKLAEVIERTQWQCLAYCLMPNHVHLMVETPIPNLGPGMNRLQGEYARAYNRRYGRRGHVFESSYGSRRAKDDAQLLQTIGYIGRNPTRASLCADPASWAWSSYAAVVGGCAPPWLAEQRLLSHIEGISGTQDPRRRYAEMCRPAESQPSESGWPTF
jgi:REP element-mobilizing transposase RayT